MFIVCFTIEFLFSCWALYVKILLYVCNNVLRLVCCFGVRLVLLRLNVVCGLVFVVIGILRVVFVFMLDCSNSKVAILVVSGVNSFKRVRR